MSNQEHSDMQAEQPQQPSFFDLSKLSKGSLQRYQTFYQKEEPFITKGDLPFEQKIQQHFQSLKLDDKQVLEKFLRLKKDDNGAIAKQRSARNAKVSKN